MAARTKKLSISILSSDTVGTTFTLDFGFAPTALLLIWGGRSGVGIGRQDVHHGRGWAVSTTARAYTDSLTRDNLATTIAKRLGGQDGCMAISGDAASDGILDLDAMLAGGARFIIDEQFGIDITVDILAVGGDIDSAFAGTELLVTTGSPVPKEVAVTGVGFQPECLFLMSHILATDGIGTNNSSSSFGAMVSATDQGVIGGASANNVSTTDAARLGRHGDLAFARIASSGVVAGRFQFFSFDADGFTYTYLEKESALVYFLALAGGSYAIKEFLTKTDGTDIDVTVGFPAAGAVILSPCTAESADNDTEATPKKFMLSEGMFSSPEGILFDQAAHWGYDENAISTSRVATARRNDAVYVRGTEVASPAVAGQMRVKAVALTITTFVMDDPDPDAAMAFGVFFGPAVIAGQAQITASVEIEFPGQVQISASVEVAFIGQQQIPASIEIEQNGAAQISASIEIKLPGAVQIPASVEVQFFGTAQIPASVEVEQRGVAQILSSVEVQFSGTAQFAASVEVKSFGVVQITASIEVEVPAPLAGGGGMAFVTRTSARADRVLSRIRRRP